MFKLVNEADFGKGKMLTAFELVNSILQDRQMSVRKSFEYGMQLQSVREGYAKVVAVKWTGGECRIFGEMIGPDEWQSGKADMTVNEFKTAFLQQKITEQMPIVFVIDGREYKIVIRTAIDNYHKQFRIWIDRDTAGDVIKESGIVLNVDDPADAAKIGGKQNAKATIVKYNGKFHVVDRYDYVSGRLWLEERPFDSKCKAQDYLDYLDSHGDMYESCSRSGKNINEDFDQYSKDEPAWTKYFTNSGNCGLYHAGKDEIEGIVRKVDQMRDSVQSKQVIKVYGIIFKTHTGYDAYGDKEMTAADFDDLYEFTYYFTPDSNPVKAADKIQKLLEKTLKDYLEYRFEVCGAVTVRKPYDYDYFMTAY